MFEAIKAIIAFATCLLKISFMALNYLCVLKSTFATRSRYDSHYDFKTIFNNQDVGVQRLASESSSGARM